MLASPLSRLLLAASKEYSNKNRIRCGKLAVIEQFKFDVSQQKQVRRPKSSTLTTFSTFNKLQSIFV